MCYNVVSIDTKKNRYKLLFFGHLKKKVVATPNPSNCQYIRLNFYDLSNEKCDNLYLTNPIYAH